MSVLTIGWVQYNTAYRHYLPYSVGLLQAYLEAEAAGLYRHLLPRCLPGPLEQEVEALLAADLVAFSVYVWNTQRSLELARRLKARKSELITVFGGPQLPDQPALFLEAHPEVDYAIHGEGEAPFYQLLQQLPTADKSALPSLSWRQPDGAVVTNPRQARRKELSDLPSPYLTGVFEPLLQAWPQLPWSALWETNRGCPFSCSFCDWGSATATKVHRFDEARLKSELDWFASHKMQQVFCCDANFGILKRDLELARYAAELKRSQHFPVSLAVQNAKNLSERSFEIQCLLAGSGLDSHGTVALQSLHPPTLKASGRANISLAEFEKLQQRLRQRGIHTYTDLILGLPEETLETFVSGLCQVVESGQYYALNLFIADILPNAPMADPAYRERYGLQTVSVPSVAFNSPVQSDPDGIVETQQLVVATASMPAADWCQALSLAWLNEFLLFKPGALRIPLLLLHSQGVPLRQLLTAFASPPAELPLLQQAYHYLLQHAQAIQQGAPQHLPVPDLQGQRVWKGAYDALLHHLLSQGLLPQWYAQAEQLLRQLYQQADLNPEILQDALFFSASALHLLQQQDLYGLHYQTRWNVWEVYQGLLQAEPVALQPQQVTFFKNWQGPPFRLQSA